MKCPKCKKGELMLYKEIELAQQHKITRSGKIHKHPSTKTEHDTEKDYLECKNMVCNQYYSYSTNENGLIIKNSIVEF